jgi:hypothetical protein
MVVAFATAWIAAPSASAATLTVDDDKAQCPGATYTKVQNAVDAAENGDTVAICPGTYVEGSGALSSNALTIAHKSIDIRGAGADLVGIRPKRSTPTGGTIADTNASPALNIRNGVGDIISVVGSRTLPVTVNISGITVDGNGVFVEAGVVYRDAGGTLARSRVTNIVTSESNTADSLAGGYRSNFPGIGVAQVTVGTGMTVAGARPALNIVQSRISRYNRIGVLIDSATNDTPPLTLPTVASPWSSTIASSQIVGRTQCTAFNTPTPPPYILAGPGATPELQLPGNCATVAPTTVGPDFGQDGVRVTAGSNVAIADTTISANTVHGVNAPVQGSATNNANLSLGSGVRLIGAASSSIARSNITDNAYGVFNVALDGTTANTGTPVNAENNFWGLRTLATSNPGPAVSPVTNPPYQENGVNGAVTVDATCISSAGAPVPGSDSVDFCPFRNGNQGDPNLGEFPVAYAPLPIADAGPSVGLSTNSATYNRGDTVTLTANATDDFAIAKTTFYDGNAVIGTAVPPASTATLTIPSNAACAARTLTAVSEDSTGQTASDTETITVVGPNNCQPVTPGPTDPGPTDPGPGPGPGPGNPPPPPPVAPKVALAGVPVTIPEAGATISADPTVDPTRTVAAVTFRLGDRTVCTDAVAPFSCQVLPTGAEVGTQSVQAVVTDSAGQSATAVASTKVAKFATRALSISVKRSSLKNRRGKVTKLVRTVSGRVTFNSRVTRRQGCSTGSVTMTIYRNSSTLFPMSQVPLKSDCTYSLKFTVANTRKHSFKVKAYFGGNSVLGSARNTRRFK